MGLTERDKEVVGDMNDARGTMSGLLLLGIIEENGWIEGPIQVDMERTREALDLAGGLLENRDDAVVKALQIMMYVQEEHTGNEDLAEGLTITALLIKAYDAERARIDGAD